MMTEENYRYMRGHLIYGLPEKSKNFAEKIKPGDRLVVYVMQENCEELCGSFTAVVEVVGEWRESSKPQFPDEEREGKVLYPRVVDVRFIAEGVVKFDEVKDELSRILKEKEILREKDLDLKGLRMLYIRKKPLPDELGRLIEERLRASQGAVSYKPERSHTGYSHNKLVEMVRDIGVWLGFKAEINHEIDNFRVDVAFFKEPKPAPHAVVEVHVRGEIDKDLTALMHAYKKYRSRPIYVITNKDMDKVHNLLKETFDEIKEQVIIIRHGELAQLHDTLRNENIRKLINELKKP
nr:EVE domain-containing protein [Vulcanisaeta thermophila]